jgi:multidrug resistance efflux pump
MRDSHVLDLADCTDYRQAVQGRPPGIVHGTAGVLTALVASALGWSALTKADLVVRGSGRVRPETTLGRAFNAAGAEVLGAGAGGRVAEVHAREGDTVKRGDLMIRLETGRLDQRLAKQQDTLRTAEEGLADLGRLEALMARQLEAARAKAGAELAQAREQVRRAQERQEADIRLVQVELEDALDEEDRLRRLLARHAAPPSDVVKAAFKSRGAREKLAATRLPVDASPVLVAERAVDLVERDYGVKREELEAKRTAKRGEVEAAHAELVVLEMERKLSEIRAPMDGVVTKGDIKVGDVLEPGKPVFEVALQAGFRFEAAVPTEEVAHLRVGMRARVRIDAYDYQRYGTLEGVVCFLSPDSEVTDEAKKAPTYLVRIALSGDEVGRGAYRGRIKLGMAGLAEIVTERESLLSLLFKKLRQTITLG